MEDAANKRSAQQLVAMALGHSAASTEAGPASAGGSGAPADAPAVEFAPSAQTEEAIELYFLAETPEERDAAFSALCRIDAPEISAFFAAMMAHDEDPYLRISAAQQLAQRGFDEARAYLAQNVVHAPDDIVFEQALAALIVSGGPAMLAPLAQIWHDEQRDRAERLAAMAGMERVAAQEALEAWRQHLEHYGALDTLDLEELGIALTGFVRHNDAPARALIDKLRKRAMSEPFEDPLDREALLAVLDEGAAVFDASAENEPQAAS